MSKRDKRRLSAYNMAKAMTGPYQPENDRLWAQEQARAGGGVAGWVMYRKDPVTLCRLTGRIETNKLVYTVPSHMPTGQSKSHVVIKSKQSSR